MLFFSIYFKNTVVLDWVTRALKERILSFTSIVTCIGRRGYRLGGKSKDVKCVTVEMINHLS